MAPDDNGFLPFTMRSSAEYLRIKQQANSQSLRLTNPNMEPGPQVTVLVSGYDFERQVTVTRDSWHCSCEYFGMTSRFQCGCGYSALRWIESSNIIPGMTALDLSIKNCHPAHLVSHFVQQWPVGSNITLVTSSEVRAMLRHSTGGILEASTSLQIQDPTQHTEYSKPWRSDE